MNFYIIFCWHDSKYCHNSKNWVQIWWISIYVRQIWTTIALLESRQFSPFYYLFRFFLKKKFVWKNINFPKRKFFWLILVTEATKMIARFLWFFSCLNFLDLKHEKNHVFFKNCKFDKLCQKHEKFYRNGTYLVPFCLFDFSANYHINFMQIWKICIFSKKKFFVVPNSKYLFLVMLNIEIY